MSDRCRSCRAPIVWAVTREGRRMPVDAEPRPDGNLVLSASDPPSAYVVAPEQILIDAAPRYRSHFSTCPNADRWRHPR